VSSYSLFKCEDAWHKWERILPTVDKRCVEYFQWTIGEKGSGKETIVLEKMHVIEFLNQRNREHCFVNGKC
jgi:hypothetical protein